MNPQDHQNQPQQQFQQPQQQYQQQPPPQQQYQQQQPQQPQYQQQQYQQQPQYQLQQQQYPPHHHGSIPGKGQAITALVLGICAIVIPIPYLDVVMGVIGLVMAVTARKAGYRGGLATAGLVLSIIGLVFAVWFTLSFIACMNYVNTFSDPWI